jgi:DNA-binding response OmpR family regulator
MLSVRPAGGAAILVIEDDDVLASQLHDSLIRGGYAAQRVGSAEEALAIIELNRVDLILMSMLLPDADGLILCSMLKDRTDAPIVMLSPSCSAVDRALALESGAVDWLMTRSVEAAEFLSRVESIVQTHVAAPASRV